MITRKGLGNVVTTPRFQHRIRNLMQVLLLITTLFMLSSCDLLFEFLKELEPVDSDPITAGESHVVLGTVQTKDGQPIGNATVNGFGVSVNSNEQGWFVISDARAGDDVISASAVNYVTDYKRVSAFPGDSTFIRFTLAPIQVSQTIQTNSVGNISTTNASITLPQNGYVDEFGNPVSGSVQAEVSSFNLATRDDLSYFPGDFEGINNSGDQVMLETFGFMYVKLHQGGRDVQLAQGKTATIQLSIASELTQAAPAVIPLWYFDEDDGIWRQEGTATRQGDVYVGEVSHFTWWNYDVITGSTTITGRVVNPDGTPVSRAMVQHLGVNYNGGQRRYTNRDGRFRMPVRPDSTIHIWAEKGAVSTVVQTESTPPSGQERDIGDLVLGASGEVTVLITLTWGSSPLDLDSHLFVPPTPDYPGGYHVYYNDLGSLNNYPYAQLDTDDRSSFGPEVISTTRNSEGTYTYCVHNYSESPDIATSEAKVTYLDVQGRLREINIPNSNPSGYLWWEVLNFQVDANNRIRSLNVANRLVSECAGNTTAASQ